MENPLPITGRSLQSTKRSKDFPMTQMPVPTTADRAVVGGDPRDCVFLPQPPVSLP